MSARTRHTVEQALRESHCARPEDATHGCVGVVTIDHRGLSLSCRLCGDAGSGHGLPPQGLAAAAEIARAVVEAAGVRWESLSPDAQLAAAERARDDRCPGCGHLRTWAARDTSTCSCRRYYWSSYVGWQEREDAR